MATSYTQDRRVGALTTPLGKDRLVLVSLLGEETISKGFEYRVTALCADKQPIDFDKAIGLHCTVSFDFFDTKREFDGILADANWIETTVEGDLYELVLRPWLWVLSKRTNSRIFHDMYALDIIKKIFSEYEGLADFRDATSGRGYPKLEYVAQYRESDMEFVCRLMEEHGISYHFVHSRDHHLLVLANDVSGYTQLSGSREFVGNDDRHGRDGEHISFWRPERKFTTGKISMVDYNFETPRANMSSEAQVQSKYARGQLESYEHPGRYVDTGAGNVFAKVRMDREHARDNRFHAEGDCMSFFPGATFKLSGHPNGPQNAEYLVLKATHEFIGQGYRSGGGDATGYKGVYELLRSDKPYAPPAETRKPQARGPQTARVVGDGEIDCDKHGRVQVRFHWDRKNEYSRRVRVGQVAAGQGWGAVFIPRVGMEVIVDFLEGDPDQPIIIGCVYNGENKAPYDLPGKKNISGWKTRSTTGGGGYNEFIMDDSKGSEMVTFHAQKDLDSTIENNEMRKIKVDRDTKINGNDTLKIDKELKITADQKITITCGKSSITMDPMSIKIESPSIEVSASLDLKTASKLTAKHEAGVAMTIQGTIVKIN